MANYLIRIYILYIQYSVYIQCSVINCSLLCGIVCCSLFELELAKKKTYKTSNWDITFSPSYTPSLSFSLTLTLNWKCDDWSFLLKSAEFLWNVTLTTACVPLRQLAVSNFSCLRWVWLETLHKMPFRMYLVITCRNDTTVYCQVAVCPPWKTAAQPLAS